ncbi:MAG: S26 family signal peptidase, partial [Rhodospirillaceae bacterium]|nr:S26 family signal peptidase [Rhodospirillaceae bacterium]
MNSARRVLAAHGQAGIRRALAIRRTSAVRNANRFLATFVVLAGLFVLAASRVHVNASWSDDAWGYLLLPMGEPRRGDAVIFDPPGALGAPAPYLKSVLGMPGDAVGVDSAGAVTVDGIPAGRAKALARDGRPLAPIAAVTIPPGHYYLYADHADSHDSRYAEIGLVPRERIRGRAVPLPDVPWLGLEGPLVQPCGPPVDGQKNC